MAELVLDWRKDSANSLWFKLRDLDFSDVGGIGVYLIWHGGTNPRMIYAGQGNIAERLAEHSSNPELWKYEIYGHIYTSWAIVDRQYLDGVENFLIESYDPYLSLRNPSSRPITVNLLMR